MIGEVLRLPSQLESILGDVQRCIDAGVFYPALAVALTLPEICLALTMTKDQFVKERHYAAFIDGYTSANKLGVDGLRCYRLRGGVIHRGHAAGHPFFGATHVTFTIPGPGVSIHNGTHRTREKVAVMLDLVAFCSEMEAGVRKWYAEHASNPTVIANVPAILSLRPDGVHPFIGGVPVVASGE